MHPGNPDGTTLAPGGQWLALQQGAGGGALRRETTIQEPTVAASGIYVKCFWSPEEAGRNLGQPHSCDAYTKHQG